MTENWYVCTGFVLFRYTLVRIGTSKTTVYLPIKRWFSVRYASVRLRSAYRLFLLVCELP